MFFLTPTGSQRSAPLIPALDTIWLHYMMFLGWKTSLHTVYSAERVNLPRNSQLKQPRLGLWHDDMMLWYDKAHYQVDHNNNEDFIWWHDKRRACRRSQDLNPLIDFLTAIKLAIPDWDNKQQGHLVILLLDACEIPSTNTDQNYLANENGLFPEFSHWVRPAH